ncbi:hypothetical protein [Pontiella desulfatans]|uniref:hypothetical protein n=1 Tax=Pontiella desulfatans TaxID=2750659 RepID=UPI00109D0085|nr:hypothetical protein [Pontiella desulfatans]
MEKLESVLPASAERHLQAAGEVVSNHPVLSSVGAIGVGAAGIAVSPLMAIAGQGLVCIGLLVAGVSGYVNHRNYGTPFGTGSTFGLGMTAVGVLVYGSSFVLMGAGGVAVATGLGVGAYSGVKAIAGLRKPKLVMNEPLMLEGGGYESG